MLLDPDTCPRHLGFYRGAQPIYIYIIIAKGLYQFIYTTLLFVFYLFPCFCSFFPLFLTFFKIIFQYSILSPSLDFQVYLFVLFLVLTLGITICNFCFLQTIILILCQLTCSEKLYKKLLFGSFCTLYYYGHTFYLYICYKPYDILLVFILL